jgi:hypothetical protein
MASRFAVSKFYPSFTVKRAFSYACGEIDHLRVGRGHMVGGVAIAMFVALAGWGGKYFGWDDAGGKVQLALVTSFILGVIGGFKAKA